MMQYNLQIEQRYCGSRTHNRSTFNRCAESNKLSCGSDKADVGNTNKRVAFEARKRVYKTLASASSQIRKKKMQAE